MNSRKYQRMVIREAKFPDLSRWILWHIPIPSKPLGTLVACRCMTRGEIKPRRAPREVPSESPIY